MKKIVTDVEQAQNKKETKEDVLQEKADAAEQEVIRLTGILNKIIEQGMTGEDIHKMKGMLKREHTQDCFSFCTFLRWPNSVLALAFPTKCREKSICIQHSQNSSSMCMITCDVREGRELECNTWTCMHI